MLTYPRHRHRRVTSLDGLWRFRFLGDTASDSVNADGLDFDDHMVVPMAFDATPAYAGRRGVAVYQTRVEVTPKADAHLEFQGVGLWCRVDVDGTPVGDNACAYTPFRCAVPPSDQAERTVTVVVDNRFDPQRAPLHEEFFDFYQYGGILRSAALHELPARWLDHVKVETLDVDAASIRVHMRLGGEPVDGAMAVGFGFDGAELQARPVEFRGGRGTVDLETPNGRPWSPESPNLHTLTVEIGEDGQRDDATVRFGLRWVEARDGQVLINGHPTKLIGYNRHEAHPQFGPASPDALILSDLQRLRDLGCNFVRGAHYPQDRRLLDLCDELGFLVWEEMLGWGQGERQFNDPVFRRHHRAGLEAMVNASINHPSVIMWGFLNEAETESPATRPIFEETVSALRGLDATRLVTYASMYPETDLHWDLVDVVSINLYPGWYGCENVDDPLALVGPSIAKVFEELDRPGSAAAGKPFLVSEIGAEAIYGWRDEHESFFSEQYQSQYLERALEEVLNNPRPTGVALWHFADARTYSGGLSLKRPRTFNNKGTLDEYRRPKQAYAAVKQLIQSFWRSCGAARVDTHVSPDRLERALNANGTGRRRRIKQRQATP